MPAAILMGHIRTEILFQRNISELRSTFCCRVWNYMFFFAYHRKSHTKSGVFGFNIVEVNSKVSQCHRHRGNLKSLIVDWLF